MTEYPKITVITVTFNLIKDGRKKTFKQCLESVHNQTYPNVEHLIVDGASTDGTLDMIKEYADKGWIRYISEPDSGHWNAMNKGAKLATGKYIIYLNSDDYFVDKKGLSTCIDALEKCGDDCYSVADNLFIKGSDVLLSTVPPKEITYRMMSYNHETLICPKKIYEKLGYHNEKYKTAIDYEFNLKLVFNDYKQIYVPVCLTAMRDGGLTVQNGKASQATIENVTTLFQNFYPWAKFNRKDVEKIYKSAIYPKRFLKRIEKEIVGRHLKNFDYEVFKTDLRNLICLSQKYQKKVKVCLFNTIPFLTIKVNKNKTYVRLFGFIPLFKKKRKAKSTKYYLFNVLPVLKIKELF